MLFFFFVHLKLFAPVCDNKEKIIQKLIFFCCRSQCRSYPVNFGRVNTNKGVFMERPYLWLRSLCKDPRAIMIGGNSTTGMETPECYYNLNLTVVPVKDGPPTGEPVDLCLTLTVPLVAQIVKAFFRDVVLEGVCRKFFRRLLTKRWAVMTFPVAKTRDEGGEWYDLMQYHRDP